MQVVLNYSHHHQTVGFLRSPQKRQAFCYSVWLWLWFFPPFLCALSLSAARENILIFMSSFGWVTVTSLTGILYQLYYALVLVCVIIILKNEKYPQEWLVWILSDSDTLTRMLLEAWNYNIISWILCKCLSDTSRYQ
jgi:hypothetical protein